MICWTASRTAVSACRGADARQCRQNHARLTPLNSHIRSTVRPPCSARSAINVQIASRPLLCAARLRRKNPVPTPAALLCAPVRQSASAPPATLRVRPLLLIQELQPAACAAFPLADAPNRLHPTPRTGPSTRTDAYAESLTPALPRLRFLLPAHGAPPPTSTPFRTRTASLSFVTCVLLVENCHHYLCLSFGVHSTRLYPSSPRLSASAIAYKYESACRSSAISSRSTHGSPSVG